MFIFGRKKRKKNKQKPEKNSLTHYGATSARNYDLVCMGCGEHRFGRATEIGIGIWKQLLPRIDDKMLRPMFQVFASEGSEALIGSCPVCQKVYDPIKFMFVPSNEDRGANQSEKEGVVLTPMGEAVKKIMQELGEEEDDESVGEIKKPKQGDSPRLREHGESGPGHDSERKV